MTPNDFIQNFRNAFGDHTELPIAFWYSNEAIAHTPKGRHCIFAHLKEVRQGIQISLNRENITCGGGKFYCGFTEMPSAVPHFVSEKERYKQSPELVREMIRKAKIKRASNISINFIRVDQLDSFKSVEGILFFATPDILSGLVTWTTFDSPHRDAVCTQFGSGCANVITYTIQENQKQGHRCFIGLFDPSARPYVEHNILSYTIPMSRFEKMCSTMRDTFLYQSSAWRKIKERIAIENH